MSETEKPKRKFWQFHLSTAVLLVFSAALILFADLTANHSKGLAPLSSIQADWEQKFDYADNRSYGWPLVCYRTIFTEAFEPDGWQTTALCIDIAVALGVLLGVAILSEWLIRRREARKT